MRDYPIILFFGALRSIWSVPEFVALFLFAASYRLAPLKLDIFLYRQILRIA